MINSLLNAIINIISYLVNLLLSPIDSLITNYLPTLSNAFESIDYIFNTISSVMSWVVDATCIPASAITLLISYWTFKLTIPILVSGVKLAIKWYRSLKL